MNILDTLKQLRDDIKTWVTNNLNALNAKIDEKIIPTDSELDSTSTNPVQNQAISKEIDSINNRVGDTPVATQISRAINAQEHFSGDYNDLTNAPDISEDDSGNMIIADESGNIIFKADADGIHTTAVSLNGETAASEKYVDEAIATKVDFTGYATEEQLDNLRREIGEGIESDAEDWKIVDEAGNIIFRVDKDGAHTTSMTLNGKEVATKEYVEGIIPEVDLTGYATEEYVDDAVASIPTPDVSGQINAHNANEESHADIRQAIEDTKEELSESIVAEANEWKVVDNNGNIIFSVDAEGAHTTELTLNGESAATESYVDNAIANIEFPETDLTDYATKKYVDDAIDGVDFTGYATETYVDNKVADLVNSAPEALDTLGELATALDVHEDAYDALLETVGSKATKTELEDMKSELSESIVSETDEFHIVDEAGNIVASIDENGVTTTTVTAQSIIINGDNVEDHIDNTNIHVTAAEKEAWNSKSNFSGSYNDLTDRPAPTDLSNYYTKTEIDTAIENVEVDLTGYATEEYVNTAISNIDIPETDLSDYYTKTETDTVIESAKEELSESIVSESEEWHIVDNNGNIVATIDASGISTTTVAAQNITINGLDIEELIQARIQTYIDQAILGGEW